MAMDLYAPACEGEHYYFISYKKENADILRRILPNLHFDIWYDNGIHFGDQWQESIASHIVHCQAMVLFLSRDVFLNGGETFVRKEFYVAKEAHKKILIVYLDDISNQDVPDSLKFWYQDIKNTMLLAYRPNRTTEELIREIDDAVARMEGVAETQASPGKVRPRELEMCSFSNSEDNRIMYLGKGDAHISDDKRKLCLYNFQQGVFEVRAVNDVNYVITTFRQPTLSILDSRLFYTARNDRLFYISEDTLYLNDIPAGTWRHPKGLKIKLEKNEHITELSTSLNPDVIFLITRKGEYMSRLLKFSLNTFKIEAAMNLGPCCLREALRQLTDRNTNLLMCTDAQERIVVLDLERLDFRNLNYAELKAYLDQEKYVYADVDRSLSHDGQIYSVRHQNNIRVLDIFTGSVIADEYQDNLQDLYLLDQKTVLKYDRKGNVFKITPAKSQVIFSATYFSEEPAFENQLPHTMFYDEARGNYFFVFSGRSDPQVNKLVIVNSRGTVLARSGEMRIPFDNVICTCSLARGILLVLFYSPDQTFQKYQSTFLFAGDYESIFGQDEGGKQR